jgi:hypothetical protein
MALRELEDSFALARIWCLCVGAVSALEEYVVYERRRVVGFITVEVDDAFIGGIFIILCPRVTDMV